MNKDIKVLFTFSNNTLWKNYYNKKLDLIVNFKGIFKGSKNECLEYAKSKGIKVKL